MKEEFLHFIWKHKLFGIAPLYTTNSEPIEVINPGTLNTDAGPDFFNAKIRIGETLWAGNVEIHIKTSDWYAHNHQNNKNYSNIILHVVYQNDISELPDTKSSIPVLIIPISKNLQYELASINTEKNTLFCSNKITQISNSEITSYLDYILIERFEEKYIEAKTTLQKTCNCWNTLFYNLLLKTFGGYTNNQAFALIAQRISFQTLLHHSDNLTQIEALLFGVAGFLEGEPLDNYHKTLQNEFEFLKVKYSLKPLESHIWKFLRLRPTNFPTTRIAQLSAIIHKTKGMFIKVAQLNEINDIFTSLDVEISTYWKTHYHFGKEYNNHKVTSIGEQTKYVIVCNVIIPFLFTFHKENNNLEKIEEIIEWLYNLPSEKNSIISIWQANGINSNNMAQSQALYHLKSRYCNSKKCISCRIGQKVLATALKNE